MRSPKFLLEDTGAYYNKACCYGLQGNVERSIASLQRAIDLDPKYQETAQTDTDFLTRILTVFKKAMRFRR
ncbi:MAG: tetratricopeptide repeat protein [Oscillatoriophycideae cyanobacterium NC_groundwater_1537_Pr4_S-0.65um_50_18]|nr:tetratricopeptide repeat protein [Oscillatoriophycideae cyanobacterium NC_groundwater_1537_Pr4_S-0.65um_50_18]